MKKSVSFMEKLRGWSKLIFSKKILVAPVSIWALFSNKEKRYQLINYVNLLDSFTYSADGMTTYHNFNFAYDEKFLESYTLAQKANEITSPGLDLRWRTYNACWAANTVKHLEGDFVECGVLYGSFSRAITHYVDFDKLNKDLYLLDTFEGTVESQMQEQEKHYTYSSSYDSVRAYFSKYTNVRIIKGMIPDTLTQVSSNKICYLSIDMNCAYPEIEAMEFFWDKLVSGAIVLMDDYAYRGAEEQMKAFDDFALKKGVKILNLPCGQGMIIMP